MSIPPFLELISEVQAIIRRDFYIADPALLNPIGANPLLDGEWLSLDTNYKLVRGTGTLTTRSFQVWTERGRYDTQAIQKVTVLFANSYEAETSIVNLTGLAVGDWLMVGDVTVGGLTKKGLIKAAGTGLVVGSVTRLPTGKVRYLKTDPFLTTVV